MLVNPRRIPVFLLLLAGVALGDAGWLDYYHPVPQPVLGELESGHPTVELVSLTATLTLGVEVTLEARYELYNSGPATEVELHFPLQSSLTTLIADPADFGVIDPTTVIEEREELAAPPFPCRIRRDAGTLECTFQRERTLSFEDAFAEADSGNDARPVEESCETYARCRLELADGESAVLRLSETAPWNGKHFEASLVYSLESARVWAGTLEGGRIVLQPGAGFDWNGVWMYSSAGLPPGNENAESVVWEFAELSGTPDDEVPRVVVLARHPADERPSLTGTVTARRGVNFRSEPNPTAERVPGHEKLENGERVEVFGRVGDWWRVEDTAGRSGWLRWRYVDPDTGELQLYATLGGA